MTVTSLGEGDFQKSEATSCVPGAGISILPTPPPFEAWAKQLRSLSDELKGLYRRTEGEFLSIGESLRANHVRAGEISRMASSLATSVSGDEIVSAIDGLRGMADRMKNYLSRTGDDTACDENSLRRIRQLLGEAEAPLNNFKKVVKNLRVLGIATKIESARLGQDSGGFGTLTENVENLSGLIESKWVNITTCGKALEAVIGQTLSRVVEHQARLHGQARAVLGETGANLAALVESHDKCAGAAKILSERSSEISRNVGEIVTSMQFHDITRQQVEHVTQAIDDLIGKLEAAGDGASLQPAGDPETAGFTGDVCELQAAHLDNSRVSLVKAVDCIVDNLRGIARNADGIAGKTMETAGSVDLADQTVLLAAERGLSSVALSLAESAAAGRELLAVVRSAAGTVEKMSVFVNDVEEIGAEIGLVALNANIKAAHTGNQGAALCVLAEAIRCLSADSDCHTAEVSKILRDIRSTAGDLRVVSGPDDGGDEKDSGVEGLLVDLKRLVELLVRINSRMGPLFTRLNDSVRALSADIDRIVNDITVHHAVSGVLADVMAGLGKIEAQARKFTPAGKSARKAENLQSLAERYTMHGERDVHHAVTGATVAAPTAPAFSSRDAVYGNGDHRKEAGHDLGANVELF